MKFRVSVRNIIKIRITNVRFVKTKAGAYNAYVVEAKDEAEAEAKIATMLAKPIKRDFFVDSASEDEIKEFDRHYPLIANLPRVNSWPPKR